MKTEKTIQINGQGVTMRYCAAVETGYESMTGKSSAIFLPDVQKDQDGNVVKVTPPEAKVADYIALALAAVIASYTMRNEEAPIDSDYILYEATPAEVQLLTATVMQLRNEWYQVPAVIEPDKPQEQQKGKKRKNA